MEVVKTNIGTQIQLTDDKLHRAVDTRLCFIFLPYMVKRRCYFHKTEMNQNPKLRETLPYN